MITPKMIRTSLCAGILAILPSTAGAQTAAPDPLREGFLQPPIQARARAYWWWLNSNVNQAAITKDLEWMKKIGMGGGLIFDAGGPAGPVPAGPVFASPAWVELFKHAVKEADRLGLELSLSPQSGWNLGGPSVKPEQTTKHITWSEQDIVGPAKFDGKLPMPPCRDNFYQDTRVLAYRLKPSAIGTMPPPEITASSSQWPNRPEFAVDGDAGTVWTGAKRQVESLLKKPEWLQLSFDKPVTLTGVKITPYSSGAPSSGEVQVSEDGKNFRTVQTFAVKKAGLIDVTFPEVSARYFRVVVQGIFIFRGSAGAVTIADVALLGKDRSPLNFGKHGPAVDRLLSKSMYMEGADSSIADRLPSKPGDEDVQAKDVIDLTAKMDKDGTLRWDVPTGTWQVFRFGCTVGVGHVSTSSKGWAGYVVNYLDPEALKSYWREVVDPLLDQINPYLGKSFKGFETDSWEGGGINWSANLPEEFLKRRGYDMIPFLPVFAGRIVNSRDASNRFLHDMRKTVGDLMADNHYGVMAQLAAGRRLIIHCESGGPHEGPFDALKNWGRCSWPMGEFWVQSPHRPTEDARFFMKGPASAAHIYDKPIACGEAFTSVGPHWNDILWSSQKPTFDHEACAGLNLIYWHAFTCSPAEMGIPGQEYFAGTHFNPQITWADQAHAFISYIDRCQFLLQQGKFVADVCYYYGDQVPNVPGRKQNDPAKVLPTFDFDFLNEEVLLTRMSVKDGLLVLPDGMSYRLLVLPEKKAMSMAALKKIKELVDAGAKVAGPRPEPNPTEGEPYKKLCDELWGTGRISIKPTKEVLAGLGVLPDFEALDVAADANLDYIHRRDGDAEIYFLSNPKPEPVRFTGVFRVSGKQPELWDAVSGKIRPATQFEEVAGRTRVPLELPPHGSLFVVLRGKDGTIKQPAQPNFPTFKTVATIKGPWTVSFDPKWGGPEKADFPELLSWLKRPEEGIKNYSGKAVYRTKFERPAESGNKPIYLDLGDVREIAEVRLNGKDLGVLWCPPRRVEITEALKAGANELEITVVNTWFNRVLFDQSLPADKRLTRTNVKLKDGSQPLDSGLLGPVTLQEEGNPR